MLSGELGADLDLAMLSRRDNAPGIVTPEGILTKYQNTFFDDFLKSICTVEFSYLVDLGFFLLSLDGHSIEKINSSVDHMTKMSETDGKSHDFTLGFKHPNAGLTIHCNYNSDFEAINQLNYHCNIRKYLAKSDKWFGLCISPNSKRIRFGINLDFTWKQSERMDKIAFAHMQSSITASGKKIGRNDPCFCGSGKKSKYCHFKKKTT